MKKLFKEFNITWKFLIIFSIVIGVLVGIINRITIFDNTSFQDIAIYLEMWIILAIFIIMNSKNVKDAISKCFVFFLISQPLIYFSELIIDVLINNKNFYDTFILYFKNYYISNGWLILTILTIPGAYIAYQVKKKNILSSIILSVATGYLLFTGMNGILNVFVNTFPYHLINSLICIIMSIYLIFILLDDKKQRILSLIITTICGLAGIFLFIFNNNTPMFSSIPFDYDGEGVIKNCYIEDENIAHVNIEEDGTVTLTSSINVGETKLIVTNDDGKEYSYNIISTSREFKVLND